MPDAARIAQATVLEIPVTIQGTRTLEGTDQRELFTESAKTTLTLECGAVLHLKTKMEAGQSVFLRNDQSGKEILCKVLEAPTEGQAGYTDLEFTVSDPEFWGAPGEEPATAELLQPELQAELYKEPEAAEQVPEVHEEIEAAHESMATLAMMESSPPAASEIPAFVHGDPEAEPEPSSSLPLPETAAATQTAEALPEPAELPEPHDTKDAEHLATMLAKDARVSAWRAAKEAKQIQQEQASEAAPKQGEAAPKRSETSSVAAIKEKAFSTLAFRIRALRFTGKTDPITLGIAAVVLLGVLLGVAWHEKLIPIHSGHRAASASSRAIPQVNPRPAAIPAQPSQIPAPIVAGSAATASHAKATPATTTPDAAVASKGKAVEDSVTTVASAAPKTEASDSAPSSEEASSDGSTGQAEHRAAREANAQEIIPPKIVSQPQPPFPQWAKDLDVDAVVKLDALIDEKGNVAETKPLSGPRALQHAAEAAVGLWMFEPAMADGKPTATHMVLTVQFQR